MPNPRVAPLVLRSAPLALAILTVAAGLALRAPHIAAQQPKPTFRATGEAVTIDASVLDGDRQPVRGLTATDFTVLEDGQPQELRTFKEIDLGGNSRLPEPTWSTDHPPDVRRNDEFRDHAVVVVVLDASSTMASGDILNAKKVADAVIDRLAPGDLAAVVHTMNKEAGQDFTQDRGLLRASVHRFSGMLDERGSPEPVRRSAGGAGGVPPGTNWMPPPSSGAGRVDPVHARTTLSTLSGIVKTLSVLSERRKALFFVSAGLPLDPSLIGPQGMGNNGEEGALHNDLFKELFALIGDANRSNVSAYAVDPGGLRTNPNTLQIDFLRSVSLDTGGIPVLNANDPAKQIEQIYRENNHYYLLGYQPANPRTEGRFRKIEVRVNRPGATVRTRSGYFEPRPKSAPRAAAPQPVLAALEGPLPLGDLPLAMTAACFMGRSGKRADVAVSVEASENVPPGQAATTRDVEVVAHAYDMGWKLKASQRVTHRLAMPADSGQAVHYALLSRLELDSGRYQLRVAVQSSLTGHRGSVYYDLTVPDFSKAPLAASGIVLDVRPRTTSAPAGAFAPLIAFDPTARREFKAGDEVAVLQRFYQRGGKDVLPVRVTARVLDAAGKTAWHSDVELTREQFGAAGEADYRVELPVSTLPGGAYLLEIAATDGRETARGHARFEMR